MTHRCPIDGCGVRVRRNHLMCWTHWFQVPVELRLLVSKTYDHGNGLGSEVHEQAKFQAIDYVNRRRRRRNEIKARAVRMARRR